MGGRETLSLRIKGTSSSLGVYFHGFRRMITRELIDTFHPSSTGIPTHGTRVSVRARSRAQNPMSRPIAPLYTASGISEWATQDEKKKHSPQSQRRLSAPRVPRPRSRVIFIVPCRVPKEYKNAATGPAGGGGGGVGVSARRSGTLIAPLVPDDPEEEAVAAPAPRSRW